MLGPRHAQSGKWRTGVRNAGPVKQSRYKRLGLRIARVPLEQVEYDVRLLSPQNVPERSRIGTQREGHDIILLTQDLCQLGCGFKNRVLRFRVRMVRRQLRLIV